MKFTLPALMLLAFSATGFGQSAEFWIGAGQSLMTNGGLGSTSTFGGSQNDIKLTDGWRLNFRMTLNQGNWFGHEVGYAYNRTQLQYNNQSPAVEQGMGIHQGFYNFLLYGTKEGSRIRPFATGGVHFSNFVPPGSSAAQGGGQTKFGINYGAGVKVKLTNIFALRLDFRQYNTGKPFDLPLANGRLRQNEISAAFGLLL